MITCAHKVGVLPHIQYYTKPKTQSKALVAVFDEKVSLPEIRGHPIVSLAKIFHNSINWICTFSMGINENNKLPNFRSSRLL